MNRKLWTELWKEQRVHNNNRIKNAECTKDLKEENILSNTGESASPDFIVLPHMSVCEKSPLNLTRNNYERPCKEKLLEIDL